MGKMKYKHPKQSDLPNLPRYELLKYWIVERIRIAERRRQGDPKPWTEDAILRQYRFCNVYREWDTVTQWVSKNWREPHSRDADLWFAMVVARLLNWPGTLEQLKCPSSLHTVSEFEWWSADFLDQLKCRQQLGHKVFGGAYIVSTNGHTQGKAEYLLQHVLTPLWEDRGIIRPTMDKITLRDFAEVLGKYNGMGGFMVGQVIADLKYAVGQELRRAYDWGSFALSGPGSRRGMNRLKRNPVDAPWKEATWHNLLCELRVGINHELYDHLPEPLHCQDLQNCLCEYDKYLRVMLGEGRPRSLYAGV
jgi:hypothetical protein